MAGDLEAFAATVWSRSPLLSTRAELAADPGSFADLFSLDAVDELLSRRGLRTPFIRIARDGAVVPASHYTRPGGTGAQVGDQVADDRVLELFADGHTVVLQGLHRMWPPVIDFAGSLTSELGHPVQVNAYVTPTQSRGFSAHYDVHDVFVLQVAGDKRWRVHHPVLVHPLRDQPWTGRKAAVEARAQEPPVIDTVLRPGDALYLPRGWLHSAEALGDVSCHLTVGVHPVTRHAVVATLLDLVADDPALRTSLPMAVDVGVASDVAADLRATVDALIDRLRRVRVEEVAGRLATRQLGAGRPAPLAPLAQAAALAALSPASVLAARGHLRVVLTVDEDATRVRLTDRTVTLPVAAAAAVRAVLDGRRLRVADLPGLGAGEAMALARHLVREGIVVVEVEGTSS